MTSSLVLILSDLVTTAVRRTAFFRSQKDYLTFSLLVPCSFDSEISFQFGTTNFAVSNSTFNFGTYSSDPNACVGTFVGDDDYGEFYALPSFLLS